MPEPEVLDPQPSPPAEPVVTEQPQPPAGAEPRETDLEPSPEPAKPPEKGGVQRRIDELTKARRLAEAETEFWKQKVLGGAAIKPADEKPLVEPNPEDFETTAEYLKAVRTFDREQLTREMDARLKAADQQREQRTQQEILADEWAEKETATAEKRPDYAEVTAVAMEALQSSKSPATPAIAQAVQDSELGPEILYYLGQHPEEVARLSKKDPKQAYFAVAGIEAHLALETEGDGIKPPPQTRAPRPPTPIRSKASPADDGELRDDLPPAEWQRRFEKKMEKK